MNFEETFLNYSSDDILKKKIEQYVSVCVIITSEYIWIDYIFIFICQKCPESVVLESSKQAN